MLARSAPAHAIVLILIVLGVAPSLDGVVHAQEQNAGPKLKLGGYVKVDFIQDFSPIANVYEFKTNAIPVDGTPAADQGGQTTIHARETRLWAGLTEETPHGEFHGYVEGDFFGDNNTFRLRHAYGEYFSFLGGQTWTTFMDISARPRSLDHEGPDSEIFVRQAMIRWTRQLSDSWKLAVAAEQPGGQFAIPDTLAGSSRSNMPDFPAHLRYEADRGHVQVAAIVRQIRFDGETGSPDATTTGFGANLSFRLNTTGKSGIMGEVAAGEGIGRYIESFNGQNVDAVFTASNDLETLQAIAAVLGYEQHWSDHLQSTAAVSIAVLDDDPLLPASAIKRSQDGRLNLIWSPYHRVDVGGELLYGMRENQDDADGDALRFQFSMIYRID